jgi:hypothetical protein
LIGKLIGKAMAIATSRARHAGVRPAAGLGAALLALVAATAADAAPPIRTSATNRVPECATPERLMAFLTERNTSLDPRFRDIARWYKYYGDAYAVRWDYAFFQMLVETNYLQFRRPDGTPGDVTIHQNNFAGIGTTGGGVPGDSFPSVGMGVLGQIQHLVVYSGQRVADPVAPRTRLKQNDILSASAPIMGRRPLTFQDLSGRWAKDRRYGNTIDGVANLFGERFCTGAPAPTEAHRAPPPPVPAAEPRLAARPVPVARPATDGPVPPMPVRATPRTASSSPPTPLRCRIQTASFGGSKTLLIRAVAEGEARYTALQVVDGFERSMADSFMRAHAAGGTLIGEFESRDAALSRANELCPTAPIR